MKIKLSHLLFSLALVAALVLAAVPAPAYALSPSASSAGLAQNQSGLPALSANSVWVCHTVIVWRNGHRVVLRRCHKVNKPAA